jgi:hypothetical protein
VLNLFIGYACCDHERVRKFAAYLRRPDLNTWMDDELNPAGRWGDEIEERILSSDLCGIG